MLSWDNRSRAFRIIQLARAVKAIAYFMQKLERKKGFIKSKYGSRGTLWSLGFGCRLSPFRIEQAKSKRH